MTSLSDDLEPWMLDPELAATQTAAEYGVDLAHQQEAVLKVVRQHLKQVRSTPARTNLEWARLLARNADLDLVQPSTVLANARAAQELSQNV